MKLTIEELKSVRFFDNYSDEQLKIFIGISSIKEFKVKDILFEQYDAVSYTHLTLPTILRV